MTPGVVLGLVAAACWGVGDFIARNASRELGAYRALFYSQFVGLAALTAYLVGTGELQHLAGGAPWQAWAWGAAAAVLVSVASIALFRAFEVGALALVAPIVGAYGAVTAALSVLTGERLGGTTFAGLGLAVAGVILASVPPRAAPNRAAGRAGLAPGVATALVATVAYGVVFWLLGWRVSPYLGGVAPIWLFRVAAPIVLLALAQPLGERLHQPPGARAWWSVTAVGALTAAAAVATGIGLQLGEVTVVTVLGSMSTVITVLIGLAVLRERLAAHQWAGVLAVLAGILVLGV